MQTVPTVDRPTMPAPPATTAYPFTVIITMADTGTQLWRREVTGPGALHIPPVADGRPMIVRLVFADGTVTELDTRPGTR